MLTELWRTWKFLPASLRAWIIRLLHALGGGLATGCTEYYMHRSIEDALLLFVITALAGQAGLHHQLPREHGAYRERYGEKND